jgi:hypothetical protein
MSGTSGSNNGPNKAPNKPKNKWGDPIYIKPGESWFEIMEEEERKAAAAAAEAAAKAAEKLRAQREQSRIALLRRHTTLMREELRRLNALAEAAPAEVANPTIGDFKKGADGQLYRWALLQAAGPGYRRQRPQWYKVSKETDYEPDLQVYLNRVRRLGTNYQTRRRNRRASRKSRRRS